MYIRVQLTNDVMFTCKQEIALTLDVHACRDAVKKTFSNHGRVELLKVFLEAEPQNPESGNTNLPWCICGRCRAMLLTIKMFAAGNDLVLHQNIF